jgi:hypothetical protein
LFLQRSRNSIRIAKPAQRTIDVANPITNAGREVIKDADVVVALIISCLVGGTVGGSIINEKVGGYLGFTIGEGEGTFSC